MNTLIVGVAVPLGAVIVGVIGWLAGRRGQAATAEKTTGEGWDLLTKGMAARLTALESENERLRQRNTELERRQDHQEDEIRLMKRALTDNGIPVPTLPEATT